MQTSRNKMMPSNEINFVSDINMYDQIGQSLEQSVENGLNCSDSNVLKDTIKYTSIKSFRHESTREKKIPGNIYKKQMNQTE